MNLKLARKKEGWTQTDLSKQSNVCRTTISRIENGFIDAVPLYTLKKLATALNSTVQELFLNEE